MNTVHALAIIGPTASGKTSVAMALAQALAQALDGNSVGAEIISLDSALVYRGMDIGTAKPSADELARVPHHLINTHDPLHSYSAAQFAKDATRLIGEIRQRGRTPLLVGGTMLYLKALTQGLNDMPAADPQQRAAIALRAGTVGWPALHAELARIDPITAARLAPHDSQRIARALEIWASTGQRLSDFHQPAQAGASHLNIPLISLEPSARDWLHQRIAQRLQQMMAQGFLDEVRQLRARGDLSPELASMRCVGYRQAWQGLDEGWREADITERALFATRQLAKRQITWLRSMPKRHVVAADAPDALDKAVTLALALTTDSAWPMDRPEPQNLYSTTPPTLAFD